MKDGQERGEEGSKASSKRSPSGGAHTAVTEVNTREGCMRAAKAGSADFSFLGPRAFIPHGREGAGRQGVSFQHSHSVL